MNRKKDKPICLNPNGNPLHLISIQRVFKDDVYGQDQIGVLAGVADADHHVSAVMIPTTDNTVTAFDIQEIVLRGL